MLVRAYQPFESVMNDDASSINITSEEDFTVEEASLRSKQNMALGFKFSAQTPTR